MGIAELRRLAEAVIDTGKKVKINNANSIYAHTSAFDYFEKAAILQLADRLEASERVCEAAEEFVSCVRYVQSGYPRTVNVDEDAFAKMNYFVKAWQKQKEAAG